MKNERMNFWSSECHESVLSNGRVGTKVCSAHATLDTSRTKLKMKNWVMR